MRTFFARLIKAPGLALGLAAALTALALWAGLGLPFLTARSAMFPKDLPQAQRFERYLANYGAANDLIVVLEGDDKAQLDAFAQAYAARVTADPTVRSASHGIGLDVIGPLAWVLVPPDALGRAAGALGEALAGGEEPVPGTWAAALGAGAAALEEGAPTPQGVTPAQIAQGVDGLRWFLTRWRHWIEAPTAPAALDLTDLLAPYGAAQAADGAFRSHDGRLAFVFVRPADVSEEFTVVAPFVAAAQAAAQAVAADWQGAGRAAPTVGFTGLPAVVVEEFAAIQGDIKLIVISSGGLILLLILVGLRSVRRAIVVFVPMGVGVVWNLGVTELAVGHLTILTSSFTAILFGLGVDYGIFLSARILAERASGATMDDAIAHGSAAALKPLLTAAGATALIFAALIPSAFPGFAELGLLAATGVLCIVLATLWIQPALVRLLPFEPLPNTAPPTPHPERARKGPSALVVALAVAAAALGAVKADQVPFDYDAMKLLPADSQAAHWQRRMLAESDFTGELVILTDRDPQALAAKAAQAAKLPSVAMVRGVEAFFPTDGAARVAPARALGRAVRDAPQRAAVEALLAAPWDGAAQAALPGLLDGLGEVLADGQEQAFSAGQSGLVSALERALEAQRALKKALQAPQAQARTAAFVGAWAAGARGTLGVLAGWAEVQPLTPAALPPALKDRFVGKDGELAAYVYPKRSMYDRASLDALLADIATVDPQATGLPTTHQVFSDLVVDAFVQGTGLAVGLALLWIALALRRPGAILLAALPLLVGGAWMLASLWALEVSFNFANIIALPLVMGLAVDYGVWFAHQAQDHPQHTGWQVARIAGRPILLAAGTTLAGLGAISLARYEGVASMGLSLSVGLLACVLAALLLAPAVTTLFFRR